MEYTIQNEHMKAVITDMGAELISLQLDGHEYLWNGDPKYWKFHAKVLFPTVGRLQDSKYTVHGKEYELGCHGFAPNTKFDLVDKSETSVTFGITETEETLKVFPFRFEFTQTYSLNENILQITAQVRNKSEETMFFGYGGHPGFMAPLEEGAAFEDYYLEFAEESHPYQVGMSDAVLANGHDNLYPLENNKIIRLRHDLFDHDALILRHMPDTVTLKSDKSDRSVTVMYPQMPYIGFWHPGKTDAPFVCIEPWVSLPGRDGVKEEFAAKTDLIKLEADEEYDNIWGIMLQ